jgi:hypothetical protein
MVDLWFQDQTHLPCSGGAKTDATSKDGPDVAMMMLTFHDLSPFALIGIYERIAG